MSFVVPESETPETDALTNEAINMGGTPWAWSVEERKSFLKKLFDSHERIEHRLSLAQTEIKEHQAKHTGIMRETDRRYDELVQDIEQGFMQGAYARLKNLQVAECKLTEAQSRIAELEKDAARYRWLRDNPYKKSARMLDELVPEELDAAIDAALKARA